MCSHIEILKNYSGVIIRHYKDYRNLEKRSNVYSYFY